MARSIVSRPSRRTPSSVPPHARAAITRATERALPCPLAAGISAARQARVLASSGRSGGLPITLPSSDSESGMVRGPAAAISASDAGTRSAVRASSDAARPM
jgi:hypothetical protein